MNSQFLCLEPLIASAFPKKQPFSELVDILFGSSLTGKLAFHSLTPFLLICLGYQDQSFRPWSVVRESKLISFGVVMVLVLLHRTSEIEERRFHLTNVPFQPIEYCT